MNKKQLECWIEYWKQEYMFWIAQPDIFKDKQEILSDIRRNLSDLRIKLRKKQYYDIVPVNKDSRYAI
jgi:hypothetical protein